MRKPSAVRQDVVKAGRSDKAVLRTAFASRQPYAAHFHDTLSIGAVLDGQTRLSLNDAEIILRKGDIVFLAPMEVHSCNPIDDEPRSYHMLYIDPAWAGTLLEVRDKPGVAVQTRLVRDRKNFGAFIRIAAAIRSGRHIPEALASLARLVKAHCVPEAVEPGCSVERFGQRSGVSGAARRAGVRRETFIRSFRRKRGITPGGYRQCLRLAKAARMLHSGCDIVTTALECGYADQSHFHRMCVKYLAATPRQLSPRTSSLLFKK